MPNLDLAFQPAKKLARLMRTRMVSAVEVLRAHIAQIERVNPKVNAIVTFLPEQALKAARALDDQNPAAMGSQAGSLARMASIHVSHLIARQGLSSDAPSVRHRADVSRGGLADAGWLICSRRDQPRDE